MDRSQGQINGKHSRFDSNGNGSGRHPSSGEIREDIEHSRQEMDATLNAISNRLRPALLIRDILGIGFGHGSGDGHKPGTSKVIVSKLGHFFANHPGPSVALGLGLTWYIMQAFEADQVVFDSCKDATARAASATKEKIGDAACATKDKISDIAHSGVDAASRAVEKGRHAVSGAVSNVGHMVGDVGHSVGQTLGRSMHTSTDWCGKVTNEYPTAAGAGILALGIITGLLIPHTRREDELVGDSVDRFKDRTKEKGREMMDIGSSVVSAVTQSASQKLREEGLSPSDLIDKVQRVASESVEVAKAKVEENIPHSGSSGYVQGNVVM